MKSVTIRDETPDDHMAVRNLHRLAFGEDSPGQLVDDLRQARDVSLSLVAEKDGQIAGHVLFSRIKAPLRALSLAPVGVHPDFQKQGIGCALIRKGLERAREEKWQAVFVLGSPTYYGRFGFDAALADLYDSPYKGPNFMALLLNPQTPKAGKLVFPAAFDEDIKEYAAREAAKRA